MEAIELFRKYLALRELNTEESRRELAQVESQMLANAKRAQAAAEAKSNDNLLYSNETTVREPYLRRDTPTNLAATVPSPISEFPMSSKLRGSSSKLRVEIKIKETK